MSRTPGTSFTERNPLTIGIVGTVVILTLMALTYRFDELPFISGGRHMSAEFAEIGGLRSGNKVVVSGTTVGKVGSIKIDGGSVRVDFDLDNTKIRLGDATKARIVTLTLLGEGGLELDPAGAGNLKPGSTIPLSRTSSPYDITNALSQLTTEAKQIDVGSLTKAVGTVSGTFRNTPADLKRALEGVTKVANTINDHDDALGQLLSRAKDVSGTLASRNAEIATLLKSGDSLLAQLNERKQVIVDLLANTTALSNQLSALVKENRKALTPALTELNKVVALLNRNKKNLEGTIDGVTGYATSVGEAVGSGPFFDAYVQNLTAPQTLAPVLSGFLK
jgi:phospholipid/cholesterol/gamma-HCH transport system substrate-binding protein